MQKTRESKSNFQFVGWYAIAYLAACSFVMGKIVLPAIFILWLFCGWKVMSFISDTFVIGDESVKTTVTIAGFAGVLGVVSLLSLL